MATETMPLEQEREEKKRAHICLLFISIDLKTMSIGGRAPALRWCVWAQQKKQNALGTHRICAYFVCVVVALCRMACFMCFSEKMTIFDFLLFISFSSFWALLTLTHTQTIWNVMRCRTMQMQNAPRIAPLPLSLSVCHTPFQDRNSKFIFTLDH